ncbi:ANTAR domain-containing protein [Streptomyces armeniacus]|uniref:ANTAR domain-containing protein n=1 Tax=Streptomyces armeniacus TaxID=83291 RepID=UPI001AD7E727|nr:ANTAR domain-containing protein [Streptomyces armeniacus]
MTPLADARAVRVLGLVTREAERRGRTADIRDVCAAAVAALPVAGAALSASSGPAVRHVLHTTDRVSGELAELQLTLGEGPCTDALAGGAPVLSADLSAAAARGRWPAFAPAARAAGAAALFALPLRGRAPYGRWQRPGVLDLYAPNPGTLCGDALADAQAFAETAALLMLLGSPGVVTVQGTGPGTMEEVLGFDAYRAEIDQAVGMLTVQLGTGVEDASVRLRGYAYAHSRRLSDVALDVVSRRLRFRADGSASVRDGAAGGSIGGSAGGNAEGEQKRKD